VGQRQADRISDKRLNAVVQMKIKIYTSNTLNGACSLVIDALGRQNTAGSRHIVIVPDKFSLSIEKEIFIRPRHRGELQY
jgi:ATP-dependent helicase/DNAse subunit B